MIAFGLGSMIYNGMELGSFFEIPWNSPCYQVLRGINPILQMIFTFSQMYFLFMNARVMNILNAKCKLLNFINFSLTFKNLNLYLDLVLLTSLQQTYVSG